jgi:hypothetical protein
MRKPLDSGRPQTRAKARDYMINVTLFLTGYTSWAQVSACIDAAGLANAVKTPELTWVPSTTPGRQTAV